MKVLIVIGLIIANIFFFCLIMFGIVKLSLKRKFRKPELCDLIERLNRLAEEEKELENFYKFKCSSFFEGYIKARLNEKEYKTRNKEHARRYNQCIYLMKRMYDYNPFE